MKAFPLNFLVRWVGGGGGGVLLGDSFRRFSGKKPGGVHGKIGWRSLHFGLSLFILFIVCVFAFN